jgi:hypothetical protein
MIFRNICASTGGAVVARFFFGEGSGGGADFSGTIHPKCGSMEISGQAGSQAGDKSV